MIIRFLRRLAWVIAWLVAAGITAWAAGALAFDFPSAWLRLPATLVYAAFSIACVIISRGNWRALALIGAGFVFVVTWWLQLKPSNKRNWQPDVSQTAWAEIDGDVVTLHNVRNCEYRTETDYTPQWETRKVKLSQITGIDIAINYWGSPWMAHPIISFQFAGAPPLCFSIETRKEVGESYSAIGGIYRQYELIYIVADERDVIRVRTNYRHGEDVYLYHTTVSAEHARGRFLEYIDTLNHLRDNPRWYNAVTTNCTTSIRSQHAVTLRAPWDWRILVNGKGDEMMYQRGALVTGGLPFSELKQRSRINDAAKAAGSDRNFSRLIREALPR
jgi:hypothetical protein